MPFRLQAKKVFLTYAQCPLEKQYVLDTLKFRYPTLVKWHIGRETHEDGNFHLHCLLEFSAKLTTQNVAAFDIDYHHPNVQTVKNSKQDVQRVWEYCGKEDDEPLSNWSRPTKRSWSEIVEEAEDRESFISAIVREYTRDAVLNLQRIEYFASKHWDTPNQPYVPDPDQSFILPEVLQLWKRDEFSKVLS